MNAEELNERIIELLKSPDNIQECADLASPEENWKKIDKNIQVPRYIGLREEDCPSCFDPIRLIFDKFSTLNDEIKLICPHCKANLICKLEYTGYTSDIYLEEDE